MMEVVKKMAKIEKKENDIVLLANPPLTDWEQEKILPSAWDLSVYEKNPVVMYAHDLKALPIAKGFPIPDKDKGLLVKLEFDKEDEFAKEVERKIRKGFLNAGSVTYIRKESHKEGDVLVTTKAVLLEVSVVPVPMNPGALVIQRGFTESLATSLELPTWDDLFYFAGIKGAVAPHQTPKAPEDLPWDKTRAISNIRKWASTDGSGDPDKIRWNRYRLAFAWYDSSNPEIFGAYKLPHHDIYNGKFVVVWKGVAAAFAAVQGARGGVNIPQSDVKGVLAHLRAHYKQFDKPFPPDEKDLYVFEEDLVGEAIEDLARALHDLKEIVNL